MKINIACGPNVFPYPGWLNIDKHDFSDYFSFLQTAPHDGMPQHQRDLANYLLDGEPIQFLQHDMTEPFAFVADGAADLIYVGQAIEHINYLHQAPAFLAECYRMLRSGGILRLTTPDLDKLIKLYSFRQLLTLGAEQPPYYYQAATEEERLALIMFGAGGSQCTQAHYEGHQHCYTRDTIRRLMVAAGFGDVTFAPLTRGEIRDEGMSHSMVVEGTR